MIKEIIATGVDANAAIESGALLLGLPVKRCSLRSLTCPVRAAFWG